MVCLCAAISQFQALMYGSREVQFPARRPFPHAEGQLRMRTYVLHVRRASSACGDPAPHAGVSSPCAETLLRMRSRVCARREVHLRMRSRVSARREVHLRMRRYTSPHAEKCISACGAGSPHAEKCTSARGGIRLRTPRSASPHAEQGLRTPRSAPPHAEVYVSARREVHLRMRSRVSARREVHLRMRRYVSARREVHLRMRRHVSARREGHFRTRKTFARVRGCVSARGERLPACGAGSPHAENVCPHAELALRMRRTLPACGAGSPHAENVRPHAELALRMRKWASCGKLHFSASTLMTHSQATVHAHTHTHTHACYQLQIRWCQHHYNFHYKIVKIYNNNIISSIIIWSVRKLI